MAIVAAVALLCAVARPIVRHLDGTVYAPGFDEARFGQIRVGMADTEVEALMGPPLETWDWWGDVIWAYTVQADPMANYHRRLVVLRRGRVRSVEHEYYVD